LDRTFKQFKEKFTSNEDPFSYEESLKRDILQVQYSKYLRIDDGTNKLDKEQKKIHLEYKKTEHLYQLKREYIKNKAQFCMKMGNLKHKGKRLELMQRADEEINMRLEEYRWNGSEAFKKQSTSRNSVLYESRISLCEKN